VRCTCAHLSRSGVEARPCYPARVGWTLARGLDAAWAYCVSGPLIFPAWEDLGKTKGHLVCGLVERGFVEQSPRHFVSQATQEPFINAIFDREPLKQLVWGRVALLGEAAHPTTPHGLRRSATGSSLRPARQGICPCLSKARTLNHRGPEVSQHIEEVVGSVLHWGLCGKLAMRMNKIRGCSTCLGMERRTAVPHVLFWEGVCIVDSVDAESCESEFDCFDDVGIFLLGLLAVQHKHGNSRCRAAWRVRCWLPRRHRTGSLGIPVCSHPSHYQAGHLSFR
jgi:hypothetical protein